MVPLYVAMLIAYVCVRWWKIFTPAHCAGISTFVQSIVVPSLCFYFIASNNLYTMNFRFLAADGLQKVVVLVLLFIFSFTKYHNLDWTITFFSLSTLPNTLAMGIPLLSAMYGDFAGDLMIQIIVVQAMLWCTLLLAMFEYRGAKKLIHDQFQSDNVQSISTIEVNPDVISLDCHENLHVDAELKRDGTHSIHIKRSDSLLTSSYRMNSFSMNDVELYSLPSTRESLPPCSLSSPKVFSASTKWFRNPKVLDELDTKSFPRKDLGSSSFSYAQLKSSTINNDVHMVNWRCNSMLLDSHAGSASFNSTDDPTLIQLSSLMKTIEGINKADSTKNLETNNGDQEKHPMNGENVENDGKQEIKPTKLSIVALIKLIFVMVWRKFIRNPNTYASAIGTVWSLIAFRYHIALPKIIDGSITIISKGGLGMIMFNLGLFMALQPTLLPCGYKNALITMVIRFLVGPIIATTTSLAVGISGNLARVAILHAALSEAVVPFVFAKQYDCHATILSTMVIAGLIISLPITIVYYVILGLIK